MKNLNVNKKKAIENTIEKAITILKNKKNNKWKQESIVSARKSNKSINEGNKWYESNKEKWNLHK